MDRRLTLLDTGLLLAFDALLRDRNITRAAQRLDLTQPALSARLARLREIFDDRLFVPATNGRGVVPTPRAAALEPALATALLQLQRLVETGQAFDPATSTRTFVVAIQDNPAMMLAPGLIGRLRALAPDTRVVLLLPDRDRLGEALESGRIDLAVGSPATADPQWIGRALLSAHFATAQRKGHPRGASALDLDGFCAHDHLLISADGGGMHGLVDDQLSKLGRTRRVAVSIQSYALAPLIVESSDLLCTLPRRLLARFGATLDIFDAPVELHAFELSAFWHPRSHDDAGHAWLREQLFAIAHAATA